MQRIILISLGTLIVVFLIIAALQPNEFRIAHSATMSAPPPRAFARVNDFRRWETWNPWGKIDRAIKQSYDGAPEGVGAVYAWVGNKGIGEGRMTIVERRKCELIRIRLEFIKPFPATNTTEFDFKPQGYQTIVR